jgi:CheY-like chemotaxis protein
MPQKILVVEDEFIISLELQDRLQDLGFDIVGNIATGEEAISFAKTTSPDAILMDIHLRGDLSGLEAADKIQSFLTIPVIFITAYSNLQILNLIKSKPNYSYLLKPFTDNELKQKLRCALSLKTNRQLKFTVKHRSYLKN